MVDSTASEGWDGRGVVDVAALEGGDNNGVVNDGAWNVEPVGLESDGVTPRSQALGGVARSRAAAILDAEASGDSDGEGAPLRTHVLVGVVLREVAAEDAGDPKKDRAPLPASILGGVVCLEAGAQGAGDVAQDGAVLRTLPGGTVGTVLRTEGMVGTDHRDGEV